MINIEDVITSNAEELGFVIQGMRNPMNSWNKSDTKGLTIGEKDLKLMQTLCTAGTDHRKYMRMMNVYMRITAPLYWWKEFDTYKVGTVSNSCSTMHKIHEKEFELDDFSHEHLDRTSEKFLECTITVLNYARQQFVKDGLKNNWWQMIQLLPSSYNQTRNVMLNYEVLANMYKSRQHHKLDEWREFCETIKLLPLSELITGEDNHEQ